MQAFVQFLPSQEAPNGSHYAPRAQGKPHFHHSIEAQGMGFDPVGAALAPPGQHRRWSKFKNDSLSATAKVAKTPRYGVAGRRRIR
jgi:hypothetical protein